MVEEERTEAGWGSGKELTMASTSYTGGKQLALIEASSSCVPYPPPQTTYEEIVANPKICMESLEKLHSLMATKFMIPIIGGKELDLHRLFVEVTSRGGIEKVIRERRWKEVTSVFNFPSTATNASFVLRKYYLSLLHHFEQIYFFKAVGWTPVNSDSSPTAATIPMQGMASMLPPSGNQAAFQQARATATGLLAGVSSSASPAGGYPVIGVIDGKFDSGYLVTVTVGTEQLKGVLYEAPPEQLAQQQMLQPGAVFAKDGAASTTPSTQRRRRRKKSEIKRRDPAHPKPNRSGYNFFFAEQHARLKPLYPGKDREISRMIGELWNKLKESERTVYQEKAMQDKERYRIEMEDYREKLRTGQVISDAVPLQQCLPEPDLNMVYTDKAEETEGGDTSYVEGDSGEYKTEEKEEEDEEDEEEEEEEDSVEASPQVGNVDVNIMVEEHSEMRPAEHCETRHAEHCEMRPVEHCEMRPAEQAELCETRPVEHGEMRPADDSEMRPAEHGETRLAEHGETRPAEHGETRPAEHGETRPAEHGETRPVEHCETRLTEHCETRPAEHCEMRPAEYCETRRTEEDVRKESSMVGDDKEVFASTVGDGKEVFASTVGDGKEVFASTVGDDKEVFANMVDDGKEVFASTVSDDKEVFASTVSDGKEVFASTVSDGKELFASTVGDDKEVFPSTAGDDKEVFASTAGDDKEVFGGDTIMVEATEEPEPTTAIREE